jgi:hypothetical protein
MGTHQDFYNAFRYTYEVFIVNDQTHEKVSIGYFDEDSFEDFMGEFIAYLKDHPPFYWMVKHHQVNEHKDDVLQRADNFIKNTLVWKTISEQN